MTRQVYCPGVCRECGCSDERPCEGGCFWVEDDLCSRCEEPGEIVDPFAPEDLDEDFGP